MTNTLDVPRAAETGGWERQPLLDALSGAVGLDTAVLCGFFTAKGSDGATRGKGIYCPSRSRRGAVRFQRARIAHPEDRTGEEDRCSR